MAVTAENSLRNVRTAARNVALRLGVDPAALSYDARITYNRALAQEILKYPASFTPATLETARIVSGHNYAPLEFPAAIWGPLSSAVTDNVLAAGSAVAGVGDGALSLVSSARWLIPIAGIALFTIYVFKLSKDIRA